MWLTSILLICAAHGGATLPEPRAAQVAESLAQAIESDETQVAWAAAQARKDKSEWAAAAREFEAIARKNPNGPRAAEALVEAGICTFSLGRTRQLRQRMTPASRASFEQAIKLFREVLTEHPSSTSAARAQYMIGTVHQNSAAFEEAALAFGTVIEKHAQDQKYAARALDRRATMRRHQLRLQDALADLTTYQKLHPKGDEGANVARHLGYLQMFEKPAPPLDAAAWVQGPPVTLQDLKGEIVVLYFFATWCDSCEKAKPYVVDLFERYEMFGVKVIGVTNFSKGQTADNVRAFLIQEKIGFPVMMDAGKTMGAYRGALQPDLIVLDRAGRVRWHDNPGNFYDATMEQLLMEDPFELLTPKK